MTDETPTPTEPAPTDPGEVRLMGVDMNGDGTISLTLRDDTEVKLRAPSLDELFEFWATADAISDTFAPRQRQLALYVDQVMREAKAAAEAGEPYVPPESPEPHTGALGRERAQDVARWVQTVIETLSGIDPTGNLPGWASNDAIPGRFVSHWRDVPLAPS